MKTFEEYLAESYTVAALKSDHHDAAENVKKDIESRGGKVLHHSYNTYKDDDGNMVHRHTILSTSKKAGKTPETVHTIQNVHDGAGDAKYKAVGAKSTLQTRTAKAFDKPKAPNGGKIDTRAEGPNANSKPV